MRNAAAAIAAGKFEDVASALERARSCVEVLEAERGATDRTRTVAVIAGISLIVAGLSSSVRVPRIQVSASLVVSAIEIELAEPLVFRERKALSASDKVRIAGLSRAEGLTLAPAVAVDHDERDVSLTFGGDGSASYLTHLGIEAATEEAPATVAIRSSANRAVDVSIKNADVHGLVEVSHPTTVSIHVGIAPIERASTGNEENDAAGTDALEFWSNGPGHAAVPTSLSFVVGDSSAWTLARPDVPIQIEKITLATPMPYGVGRRFVPSVLSGTLLVGDSPERVEITEREPLSLMDVKGSLRVLAVGEGVDMHFVGTAGKVLIGSAGFQRNLKPTVLEFLRQQRRLGYFWAALVFLWGLGWSVRRYIPV